MPLVPLQPPRAQVPFSIACRSQHISFLNCDVITFEVISDTLQPAEEVAQEQVISPNLDVSVHATFPQAEVFGVKVINGRNTHAVLDIINNEAEPITIDVVGGALSSIKTLPAGAAPYTSILRNLTSTKHGLVIPAGQKESVPYTFNVDMQPADLRLQLVAVISDAKGAVYQVQAFNESVSVVEAPTSFFDPKV